jgi:hypothetical protein
LTQQNIIYNPANRTHASIGGRYRRNLLTFDELSKFYTFLILFYLFDSIIILIFYKTQDMITQDNVFLIYHAVSISFDLLCVIILPTYILCKSRTDFPVLWSNYSPKSIKFYTTKAVYVPRREGKQAHIDSTGISIPRLNEGPQGKKRTKLLEITERYLALNVSSGSGALPKFVQKIKEEIPTENTLHLRRRPELENKWKAKFIKTNLDEKNMAQNMEEKNISRKLKEKTIFHFENESGPY